MEAFYQAEINSLKKKLGQQKLPPMKFMGKKNERKLNVDKKSSNNKENEKGQEKMSSDKLPKQGCWHRSKILKKEL